ncbi:hypothetical protein [Mycolicibacterium sphagni]|uniref:hypothetical protein n=1 Tax=Mycolicibacterium sphagni TaxID=1786 RepID=UPI0021F318F2|nr:hypothetical protein [Mycolicibacterium sphagni]MCV7174919.1 hypothetical protein [Mycolicibacterium sphagni]
MKRALAGVAITAMVGAGIVTACSSSNQCLDPNVVCDEGGSLLIYAPYIIPAFGIYGTPSYRPAITIQPGAPGYIPRYQGKPPNYAPPRPLSPPASNPRNTVPAAPLRPAPAPAPAGSGPKVNAPSVSAPKVNAPSVKSPSISSSHH